MEEVMRRKREKPAKAMACMAANVALVEKGRAAYLYTRWRRADWGQIVLIGGQDIFSSEQN